MGKTYKGWELMKAIEDGEIKDGSKFKTKEGNEIKWNGINFMFTHSAKYYMQEVNDITFLQESFELIEDEIDIDNIKELEGIVEYATEQDTINKLIQAVKQIDKRVKKLERD